MIRPRFSAPLSAALLLAVAALSSCDSADAQRGFEADAALPPVGITPTDLDGNPVGPPDSDDWRTSPTFPSTAVGPAYPNPVAADYGGAVIVPIVVPFSGTVTGGVSLLLYDPRLQLRPVVLLDELPADAFPGAATLRFTMGDLRAAFQTADARGLYRAYIQDGTGRLISYGDIQVN
jgi:hypothetical protein